MTDEPYTGPERRTYNLEIGLAKIEGKLDAMIAVQTATTASVSDLDKRVRALESLVAALKQQMAGRLPWTTVTAAVAAIIGVGLVIADRIYHTYGG